MVAAIPEIVLILRLDILGVPTVLITSDSHEPKPIKFFFVD